jgi:TonB-linked SusC/RagA family outer membrane protein
MNLIKPHALFGKGFLRIAAMIFLTTGASAMFAATVDVEDVSHEIIPQTPVISGTVRDVNGDPLVGVTVLEKGTRNVTVTSLGGAFDLRVEEDAVLVVSFLGYKTKEIPVGGSRRFDIVLEEDVRLIDEVVVIGYGTQRKGDVTSAIVSVKAEDFSIGKIGDAAELVKGKVAGLSIVKSSGDPNALSSIMLRGVTTLMGNVSPLVLVDGIEGNLSTVAPENVASIDVLKDASAAAIYGTRGANGVILVTTKTGTRGAKATATYSSYVSFSGWYKKADFMDTNDIIYGHTNFPYEGYDTDWLAAISRKAGYTQNHSLTLTGGSNSSAYSANVTYRDEEGILRQSDSRNLKAQLDFTQYALNDMLKFNINLLYSRHKNSNNDNNLAYREALIRNPSSPIYNQDGSYYEEFSRFQYWNPVAMQDERIGDTRSQLARVTGNVTFEPIKGWQTNLMLSVKDNSSEGQTYYTDKFYSQVTGGVKGWAAKSSTNSRSDNVELTSKYDFTVQDHRVSALAGYSYLYNVSDGFSAGNGNFPTQAYLYNNMGEGTYLTDEDHTASMGSYKNDNKLIGFFGRVTYGYADRYNALVSLRYEGSSKFGPNNKWGAFPSVSLSWNINNEEFMKSQSWLNNLKLRAGYGVTGVIPGDSYLSLTMFDYDPYGDHLSKDGTWTPSLRVSQNPNPNLKWETTREFNVGLDWSVLNDRLGGAVDVYTKTTSDLLYDYSVPVPPNIYGTIRANVGKMRNDGIEVMINAVPVKTSDFEYNTTLTLSHNRNKLLSLDNDLYETDNFIEVWDAGLSDPISVPTHCVEVGGRLGDYWGLKSVGVSKNGIVLVEVSDGNGGWVVKEFDTKYNEKVNRQRLGNGMPQVYAGWSHTFRYKGFDLSLQFTGQFGFKILNIQRSFYENNSIAYNRLKSAADWYGAVDETGAAVIDPATGQQQQVQLSRSMTQGYWSDHLENGDFVKLTNATLGYTIPLTGAVRKYISQARVYVSGQNLFCITGYSGLDPEVSNYYWSPGVDSRDKYPTIRSFTVGLNINF